MQAYFVQTRLIKTFLYALEEPNIAIVSYTSLMNTADMLMYRLVSWEWVGPATRIRTYSNKTADYSDSSALSGRPLILNKTSS